MHCVSTYPAQDNSLNLKAIQTLSHKFNCNVGYSGHETGVVTSVAAVAMGATSIERHITLDRTMYGSDQSASLEIRGFTDGEIIKMNLLLEIAKEPRPIKLKIVKIRNTLNKAYFVSIFIVFRDSLNESNNRYLI